MTFPIRFLICNLFIAILLALLLIIKQLFRKQLTLNAQYGLWYVFAASLILPFLPCRIFSSEKFFLLISQLFRSGPAKQVSAASGSAEKAARTTDIWIHDFSTAVASASSPWFIRILWGIWIAGGCLVALYFTYNILRIYLLRKRAYLITAQTEPELYRQYKNCLKELHIRHPLTLYASCSISSPVSGKCRRIVNLPATTPSWVSSAAGTAHNMALPFSDMPKQCEPVFSCLPCQIWVIQKRLCSSALQLL